MNLYKLAAKGSIWLMGLTTLSQIISWVNTIILARILSKEDYAYMDMATIFTGYVFIFSELGLGAAIVQKKEVDDESLSSLFWLSLIWGCFLGFLCFPIGFLTQNYYQQEELLELAWGVSLVFVFSCLYIVPRNVLYRNIKYKLLGIIESISIVLSCIFMYFLATSGAGAWTLMIGHITKEALKTTLALFFGGWRPNTYFKLNLTIPYLKFGLPLLASSSINYIIFKADTIFGARVFSPAQWGNYTMAKTLCEIPQNKVVSIVNQILFPIFSKLQDNKTKYEELFFYQLSILSAAILPIFAGLMLTASEFIPLFLGEKWENSIYLFQLMCIGQLFVALSSVANITNMALGRPRLPMYFQALTMPPMLLAFIISSRTGLLNNMAIPWLSVYPIMQSIYFVKTLRLANLSVSKTFKSIAPSVLNTLIMIVAILISVRFLENTTSTLNLLIIKIIIGITTYGILSFIYLKDKWRINY